MQSANPRNPHEHHHHHHDHIARDAEAQAAKRTLMNRLKTNTRFSSISRALGAIGGPLFAVSLTLITNTAMGVGGLAAVTAVSWGVLAVGAAFTVASLAADYVAARSWQSSNIDTQEATAQSTGRHIAQELKKEGLCISTGGKEGIECETNRRTDGKSWVQAVAEQQQQQAAR